MFLLVVLSFDVVLLFWFLLAQHWNLPGQMLEYSSSMGSISCPKPKVVPSTNAQPFFFLSKRKVAMLCKSPRTHAIFKSSFALMFFFKRNSEIMAHPSLGSLPSAKIQRPSLVLRDLGRSKKVHRTEGNNHQRIKELCLLCFLLCCHYHVIITFSSSSGAAQSIES